MVHLRLICEGREPEIATMFFSAFLTEVVTHLLVMIVIFAGSLTEINQPFKTAAFLS